MLTNPPTNQGAVQPGTLFSAEPVEDAAAAAPGGSVRSLFSLFRTVTEGLFDLEAKLVNQASATQRQGTQVKQLRSQVAAKKASAADLVEAEKTYTRMTTRLDVLSKQFDQERSLADRLMKQLGLAGRALPTASDVLGTGYE